MGNIDWKELNDEGDDVNMEANVSVKMNPVIPSLSQNHSSIPHRRSIKPDPIQSNGKVEDEVEEEIERMEKK